MDEGDLVPDEVTIAMAKDRMEQPDAENGFLLDGFPRNVSQAEALDEMLQDESMKLDAVLDLEVPEDEVVKRIAGRRICRNDSAHVFHVTYKKPKQEGVCDVCGGELYQRDDDSEETVRKRLEVYHTQTEPIIDYYKAQGLVVTISALGTVEDVTGARHGGAQARGRRQVAVRRPVRTAAVSREGRRGRCVWRGRDAVMLALDGCGTSIQACYRSRERRQPHGADQDPRADRQDARGGAGRRRHPRGHPGGRGAGATTKDLDEVARKVLAEHGAKSNFLGYGGFPATICTSVNEVVVHGIPSDEVVLKDGDIISIDCGAIVDGWHGDAAYTAFVGSGHAPELIELSRVTEESMWAGHRRDEAGQPARRRLPGHRDVHPPPAEAGRRQVRDHRGLRRPWHRDRDAHGPASAELRRAAAGEGAEARPRLLPRDRADGVAGYAEDARSSRTTGPSSRTDGTWSSHWEHSVALTEEGPLVLTAPDGGKAKLAEYGIAAAPDPLG